MRNKAKKILIICFFVLLLDDLCRYISIFSALKTIEILEFGVFKSVVSDSVSVYNLSTMYIMLVMTIYFVTHFFRDNT